MAAAAANRTGIHTHTTSAQRANLQKRTVSTAPYYLFTSWDCATYLQSAHGTYMPGYYGFTEPKASRTHFGWGKRETKQQGGVYERPRIRGQGRGCTTGAGKGRVTHLRWSPYLLQNKQTEGHQKTEMHRQYKSGAAGCATVQGRAVQFVGLVQTPAQTSDTKKLHVFACRVCYNLGQRVFADNFHMICRTFKTLVSPNSPNRAESLCNRPRPLPPTKTAKPTFSNSSLGFCPICVKLRIHSSAGPDLTLSKKILLGQTMHKLLANTFL